MENKSAEIQAEINRLRGEQAVIAYDVLHNETLPSIRARIGETFVYRGNSFGGGEPKFDTFRKLIGVQTGDYNLTLLFEEVQIDSHGRPELSIEFGWLGACLEQGTLSKDGGWKPCDLQEYETTRSKALQELQNPVLAMAYARKQ
jgi:hypothetical protein